MTSQPKQPSWPNNATFWRNQRVTVTGGAGFLGSFVVEKLRERGAADISIPRREDYDLVQHEAVLALLHDARPDLIIHLAARVGGNSDYWDAWRLVEDVIEERPVDLVEIESAGEPLRRNDRALRVHRRGRGGAG
ncbi:MAG: NAD-dependent epimerase/dehydratase family protein [Anaerolineae bacterium]